MPMPFVLLALLQGATIHSPPDPRGWHHYANARYAYSICTPPGFTPRPEAENGDGREFLARDGARLAVWGSNLLEELGPFGAMLRSNEEADVSKGARIIYHAAGATWGVSSGIRGSRAFYRKSLLRPDRHGDQVMTFELSYPRSKDVVYRPIAERLSRCFTIARHAPF